MNDKFETLVFYGFLFIISNLTNKYILEKSYNSANLSLLDVLEYRKSLRASTNQFTKLKAWVLSVSPNPQKTKRWLALYGLISAPSIICLSLSIMGLFINIFDSVLSCAWIFLIALIILTTISRILNKIRNK